MNPGPRRLYRSKRDRMLTGVCGGIAEYFNLDPSIVRLITVALLFFPGTWVFYLAAAFIVPEK